MLQPVNMDVRQDKITKRLSICSAKLLVLLRIFRSLKSSGFISENNPVLCLTQATSGSTYSLQQWLSLNDKLKQFFTNNQNGINKNVNLTLTGQAQTQNAKFPKNLTRD
jgi:hypothetical protein